MGVAVGVASDPHDTNQRYVPPSQDGNVTHLQFNYHIIFSDNIPRTIGEYQDGQPENKKQKTKVRKGLKTIYGKFRVAREEFNDELSNPESDEYKKMSRKYQKMVRVFLNSLEIPVTF